MYFFNQIKENYIFLYENISFSMVIAIFMAFYFYLRQIELIIKKEKPDSHTSLIYLSFIPFIGQFYLGIQQRKIFLQSRRLKTINFRELVILNNLNNVFLVSFFMFLLGFYIAGVIFILSLFILYFKINNTYYKEIKE